MSFNDEKPFFEVIRNWINFRLRSFLYQGTLWQTFQAAISYKLVVRLGGRGHTFKTSHLPYEQLFPLPTPCFEMFLEKSLNDPHPLPRPPPPHFKHFSLLSPPHSPPLPPK